MNCENVRSLRFSVEEGGCSIGEGAFCFPFRQGDRFSDLEDLTIHGYEWAFRRKSWRCPSGVSSGVSQNDAWKKAMDWSKFKRLEIAGPLREWVEAFKGNLSSLEELQLGPSVGFWGDWDTLCDFGDGSWSTREAYTSFIVDLPPLRKLSVSGTGAHLNITPIIAKHGQTLEELSIHEYERDCGYETVNSTWSRPFLSIASLNEINAASPSLRSLTLDVYRSNNKWPLQTLRALSSFPNITHLTIHFDLENPYQTEVTDPCMFCRGSDFCIHKLPMQPTLNDTSATELFRIMRAAKVGEELRTVDFVVGDYARPTGGGLRIAEPWDGHMVRPKRLHCYIDDTGERCDRERYWLWDDDDLRDVFEAAGEVG